MSSLSKKVITFLILISFLMVVFFGLALMVHKSDGSMVGNCPLSLAEESICSQNTLATAIHHISAYQSFLNVPIGSTNINILLISLLLATLFFFIIFFAELFKFNNLFQISRFDKWPPVFSGKNIITRWLSLFENSPSFNMSA